MNIWQATSAATSASHCQDSLESKYCQGKYLILGSHAVIDKMCWREDLGGWLTKQQYQVYTECAVSAVAMMLMMIEGDLRD
eukprot:scaffold674957_cov59-Prasinocladus_malaysianus.AAC.1